MEPENERLIDTKQVAAQVGVSIWTIWDWVRKGRFPPPAIRSGAGPKRWRQATVNSWIKNLEQQAPPPAPAPAETVVPIKRGVGRPRKVQPCR